MRIFGIALVGLFFLEACGGGAKGTGDTDGGAFDAGADLDAPWDAGLDAPPGDAGLPSTPPTPPFIVEVTLNDGSSAQAPRGWPLILTGVAALWDDVTVPLTAASVTLQVSNASRETQAWPLTQVTTLAPAATLDADHESAEVAWLLSPAQTSALAVGSYEVRLTWGGQAASVLPIEIVEPPTGLAPADAARAQARLASLTARAALLQNDPAAALVALDAALIAQPTHVGLLTTQALSHEAAGSTQEALRSADAALTQLLMSEPAPTEPVSTMELRNRLLRTTMAGGAP
jgi:hypothetical protein